jgi:drug/metabolite transporter (DMT)-like permease
LTSPLAAGTSPGPARGPEREGRPSLGPPVGASILAAFLWASYYPLLLLLPGVPAGTVTAFPILVGALAFWLWTPGMKRVPRMGTRKDAGTWILGGVLLAAMQFDVVFTTRWLGAVDTSLLTLVADVVVTPTLLWALWREGGPHLSHPYFVAGVVLSLAGAVLAIGGPGVTPLVGGGSRLWVGLPLPFLVALFFLLISRQGSGSNPPAPAATFTLGALLALAIGFAGDPSHLIPAADPRLWSVLLLLGLTSFFWAPAAYFWAASRATIVIPAVLQALIPIFTLLFVAILFGHPPSMDQMIGVPLAVAGGGLAIAPGGLLRTSPPT